MQKQSKEGFLPLADICFQFLDPVLRKQTGIGIQVLESWPEIVGKELSEITCPFKLNWPPRKKDSNGKLKFEPGTLIIACEARAGIIIQHSSESLIQSLERILGPATVNRIKVITQPVYKNMIAEKQEYHICKEDEKCLKDVVSAIENDKLRQILFNLGKIILSEEKSVSLQEIK